MTAAVVVPDQAFGGVRRERALAERMGLSFAEHQCRREDETAAAVAGARIAFVNFAPMTRSVLSALAPGAAVIRYGIGYDNVDVVAAQELGVHVSNVPDYGVSTVADHTLALLLALLRRLPAYDRAVRDRGWLAPGDLGALRDLPDTTIGLIGSGRIGRAVLERLRPFGCRVLVHDPYVPADQLSALGARAVELDALLASSHAVSLHIPLTPATRHVLDDRSMRAMPRGALVVNTSRGGLVDETALAIALTEGRLGAAALDVFEHEPLPENSSLRSLPNLLLTPHAAFFSAASLDRLQRLATEEAERALTGVVLSNEVTR